MLQFSFDPILGSWLFVELILFCLIGILILFPPSSERLTLRRRRILFLLRCGLVFLIGLIMLRPSIIYQESRQLPATLLMLFDQSESMNVSDEVQSASRFEQLKTAIGNSKDSIANFQKEFEIKTFGFDSVNEPFELNEGTIIFPEKASGKESAIGFSLLSALQQNIGKRTLGLILLSDGSQRVQDSDSPLPQDAAIRFRDAGIPIYSVPFGQARNSASLKDISVCDLLSNDRVFVNNELTVSGQLKVSGYSGNVIPIHFLFETSSGKMELVQELQLSIDSDDKTIPFHFNYIPKTPGEWKLSVSIPIQSDEFVSTNNELSSFVRVIDGGLKVFYFEGTRRFEQKFIRMALNSSADITVDYWRPTPDSAIKVKTNANQENNAESETLAIAQTTGNRKSFLESNENDFFKPGKYAAYILGDIDSTAFKEEELKRLAELVAQGTGLIILGGERSFSAGGYASTPLSELFPFSLRTNDRIPLELDLSTFDASLPQSSKLCLESSFGIIPTEIGKYHYLTQLSIDSQKNFDVWKSLPPIDRVYRVKLIKPGATVLLNAFSSDKNISLDHSTESPITSKKSELPLLITQLYGLGRVAVLTTDSTWKWKMNGFDNEHKQFWRRLVLWSAKMDELLEGELIIQLDKNRFAKEEPVSFQIVYQPKEGENIDQLRGKAVIISPSGVEENVSLTEENGKLTGSFYKTENAGDYRIKATMTSQETGSVLQSAQTRFLVFEENLELDHPEATPSIMENIAAMSNGKTVRPNELSALFDELAQNKTTYMDTREIKKTFYDSWIIFLTFVGLISSEWFFRKIWGLV
ncbi:MAG: hypothetical protein Q4C95_00700 [Planctomycetia bacterium]|nr:hypothetical protein [Planctomycetia bacterium]